MGGEGGGGCEERRKEKEGRDVSVSECATYMREKDGEEGGGGVVGIWTSRVRSGEGEVV